MFLNVLFVFPEIFSPLGLAKPMVLGLNRLGEAITFEHTVKRAMVLNVELSCA